VIGRETIERDGLILVCAISAGIHAALIPAHVEEGSAAGLAFALSAVVLAGAAAALTRSLSPVLVTGTAAVLAGLIASYAFAVTTGVPVLHPEVEPVEGLALLTKAVELVGLAAALDLLARRRAAHPMLIRRPKGTLA
jgi:hypothetical protein